MKKILIGFLSVFYTTLWAQFDAQTSQYMLHNQATNPAAVGESSLIEIVGQHRINMIDMPGGGSVTVFSINSPLKIGSKNHGFGLKFLQDKVGWFSNESMHLQYAYKKKIADGRLSIGVEGGFVSLKFAGDSLTKAEYKISEGEYHSISGDEDIPQTSVVGMAFDMGIGAWYTAKNWYAGCSYLHTNRPTVKWGQLTEFNQFSQLTITGGYDYEMNNPKYRLKPSVLVKSDLSAWLVDVSARVEYDSKVWGGLSVRPFSSVAFLVGTQLNGGLSFGFAYDLPTSRMIKTNFGSPELLLSYSFEYVFSKPNSKYRSVRYL
jgi:type IX secretion system PorP/SprF family membrane protein